MHAPHATTGPGGDMPENPARRRILVSAGLVAAAGALLPWSRMAYAATPAQASAAELDAFLTLGRRLTGRDGLPADISARLFVALAGGDRGFPARIAALARALDAAGIDDMRRFKDSPVDRDPDMKALVVSIVSGWYLGYTGEPKSLVAKDDTAFITYTGALMFEPTHDVTVIPTYARAGTDYWAAAPTTIASD
ncbi:sorbitol dehydrogenase family protein [Bacillus sp. NP157]|nr:sorbitol dehydrogenase family protein [Bacillus sp. NP157]